MEALGEVAGNSRWHGAGPAQTHVAVRPQQIEGGARNPRLRKLADIIRIFGNDEDVREVAEGAGVLRRRLADHDQGESRVVESLEEVFDGSARDQPQLEPGEPVA